MPIEIISATVDTNQGAGVANFLSHPQAALTSKKLSIFVSATTRDLGRSRERIAKLVEAQGFSAVVEESFEACTNDVEIARFLNLKLRGCSGVIHLSGLHYGEEAHAFRSKRTRTSWTQMEYQAAKRSGKPMLVCLRDAAHYKSNSYQESGSVNERRIKAKLQRIHYDKLRNGKGIFHSFMKNRELDQIVDSFLRSLMTPKVTEATKILLIGAEAGTGLDLKHQFEMIKRSTNNGQSTNRITIDDLYDLTPADIIAEINKRQPTIVHISGKQDGGIIKLHNAHRRLEPFSADRLASALAKTNSKSLKVIILDTCYSMQQAKRLTRLGISHAVGVYDAIADDIATEFYASFYNHLASGGDLESACDTARHLVVGTLEVNPKLLKELEREVLEMRFDEKIHIPRLSSTTGFDPKDETFC